MSETVRYKVIKTFKYGDRKYKPGEYWEPQGGLWDDKIKKAALDNSINRQFKIVVAEVVELAEAGA